MFRKYTSIENTYREEYLERIKGHGFWDDEYIVQEKVHGANLSFWTTDGEHYTAAKRGGNLEKDERFYNHAMLTEQLQPQFAHLWALLKDTNPELQQMTVYGEVIGGNYPHKEVARDKTAIKIQKGIYYSPHNIFFAFDIMTDVRTYLDVDVANAYFEQIGILHAKTLFRGTLSPTAWLIPIFLNLP